jgi:glycosyltransferase involved in cell wall biosynthesis
VKVCAYTIMRDEAENAVAWSETTIDADTRFVLDTGSADGTAEELEFVGVGVRRAVFDPFRFDDARNAALALAPEADLYFRLDADERLPDDWRVQLDDAYDPHVRRYRYLVHNHGGIWETTTRDDLHVRQGMRWKYPTHEVLVGAGPILDLPRLVVEHRSPVERRPHHLTNLNVLYQAVVEYPGDHRMAFYYARELWYAGNWDRCREAMTRFLALPGGWAMERAEGYRILAAIDYEPERWLWKAIGEAPERREPWVDLARHYLGVGRDEQAIGALNFAYHRNDDTLYTTDPQCWGAPFQELMERCAAIDADEAHAREP